MEKFLGEPVEFWCKVRAAMRKANIDTASELEARLGVCPPIYETVQDGEFWKILSRQPTYGPPRVMGWSTHKLEADEIAQALAKTA